LQKADSCKEVEHPEQLVKFVSLFVPEVLGDSLVKDLECEGVEERARILPDHELAQSFKRSS
jgi:hypothetical protein